MEGFSWRIKVHWKEDERGIFGLIEALWRGFRDWIWWDDKATWKLEFGKTFVEMTRRRGKRIQNIYGLTLKIISKYDCFPSIYTISEVRNNSRHRRHLVLPLSSAGHIDWLAGEVAGAMDATICKLTRHSLLLPSNNLSRFTPHQNGKLPTVEIQPTRLLWQRLLIFFPLSRTSMCHHRHARYPIPPVLEWNIQTQNIISATPFLVGSPSPPLRVKMWKMDTRWHENSSNKSGEGWQTES